MLSRNAVTIFVVVVAEFFVFSRLIDAFGLGTTLLASLALAALGVVMLRRNLSQIPAALQEFINPLNGAAGPDRSATSGSNTATKLGLNALGALLLIIPGFLSSLVGALLFLPPVRAFAGPTVEKRMQAFQPFSAPGGSQPFDLFDRMRQANRRSDGRIVDVDTVDDGPATDPTRSSRTTRPELR